MTESLTYETISQELAALLPQEPLPLLLARSLALQAHYEEKSVGDLFALLDGQVLEQAEPEAVSQLGDLLSTLWHWLQTAAPAELSFLACRQDPGACLEQRGGELRAFIQIALAGDEERLLHYGEERVQRLTLVVRALREINSVADPTPETAEQLGRTGWEAMLACRPDAAQVSASAVESEAFLSARDQVYLALREIHGNGSWEPLLAMLQETEELTTDWDPAAIERLRHLEEEGRNLLEALPPETLGLIDNALQLTQELTAWCNEEPQSDEEAATQQLARLLLYRNGRAEDAYDALLALGPVAVNPLRKLLGDVLCQHVVGPGYGLNFNRLIELSRELGSEEFQNELLGLLQTTLPRILEAAGDVMAATPDLFLPGLRELFTSDERDVSHFNALAILPSFPEAVRQELAELLLRESHPDQDREWSRAVLRYFATLERNAATYASRFIAKSRDGDTRLQLEQLQQLDSPSRQA